MDKLHIVEVYITRLGMTVTFDGPVSSYYAHIPGSKRGTRITKRRFPYQYSIPAIFEAMRLAIPKKEVEFVPTSDFAIVYDIKYEKSTYSPKTDRTKITEFSDLTDSVSLSGVTL